MTDSLMAMAAMAVLALAPIAGLLLARRRLGSANAAAWLVTYGALIIFGEHTLVGLGEQQALTGLAAHARFHWIMAGIHTAVGAMLLVVIGWTLLREGRPAGWVAVLLALLVGGSAELLAAGTVFPHGFPPRSIPLGLFLYAYLPALAGALGITFRQVFRPVGEGSGR